MRIQRKTSLLVLSFMTLVIPVNKIVAEESDVPVYYDYDNIVQTENVDYVVSIPAGIVFSAVDPEIKISIDVEMITLIEGMEIAKGSKADVSVASRKGYVVSLDAEGKDDSVEYQLAYGENKLEGKENLQKIGTLKKGLKEEDDVLILKGNAIVMGAANKTGNHSDVLTYRVEDTTNK